jgi:hypothetical protein
MSRQRRRAPGGFDDLSRIDIAWLTDQPRPTRDEMTESERWDDFGHQFWRQGQIWGDRTPFDLWRQYGPAILASWVVERPATRPMMWWRYDCPVHEAWMPRCNSGCSWQEAPDPAKQAAYLKRHGLLLPSEEHALTVQRAVR